MKKIISFIIVATFFLTSSCLSIKKQTAQKTADGDYLISMAHSYDLKLTTITIDSCEYLMGMAGYDARTLVMTHKGNCKYCAIRQKAQQ